MTELSNFIKPELLILIPFLYFLGCGLRISELKNKYIPAALGIAGMVLALLWCIATAPCVTVQDYALMAFTAIVQGGLCAGGSVYCNEMITQSKKEE